jgi:hypothetical protein
MKKLVKVSVIPAALLSLFSCGQGTSSTAVSTNNTENVTSNSEEVQLNQTENTQQTPSYPIYVFNSLPSSTSSSKTEFAYAQLGNLADAVVNIYEISPDGTKVLRWKETTSEGSSLEEIGKFNPHIEELNDEAYYLYEVSGGEDWDSNDDGIIDDKPTENKGTIRLIAKGKVLKSLQTFRVTTLSELLYEKCYSYAKLNLNNLEVCLNQTSKEFIFKDLTGDGVITAADIYVFNPVENLESLNPTWRELYRGFIKEIHSGSKSVLINGNFTLAQISLESAVDIAKSSDNNTVALALGSDGVVLIDVEDISNPILLKQIQDFSSNEYVRSVDIFGNGTFLAVGTIGLNTDAKLYIYDIGNRTNPVLITSAVADDGVLDVTCKDNLIFAAVGNKGFDIFEFDGRNLSKLSQTDTEDTAYGLAIDNNTLFVADGTKGLTIFDVSDPENPNEISNEGLKDGTARSVKLFKKGENSYAVVAAYEGGIAIYNVTDINNPQLLKQIPILGNTWDIAVDNGSIIAVTDYPSLLNFSINWDNLTLDVDALLKLQNTCRSVVLKNGIPLIANMNAGFTVINPFREYPWVVRKLKLDSLENRSYFQKLYLFKDKERILNTRFAVPGIYTIDISDPLNAKVTYTNRDLLVIFANSEISPDGNFLYIPDVVSNKLHIYSLQNLDNITLVSKDTDLPDFPFYSIAASKDNKYLYVGGYFGNLTVYDVSNKTSPTEISSMNTGDMLYFSTSFQTPNGDNILIQGVYDLSKSSYKTYILNATDPEILKALSELDDTFGIYPVVFQNILFIPNATKTAVNIYNISDVKNPQYEGALRLSDFAWQVYPTDKEIFATDGIYGIRIFDSSYQEIECIPLPDYPISIVFDGRYIYSTAYYPYFYVIDRKIFENLKEEQ